MYNSNTSARVLEKNISAAPAALAVPFLDIWARISPGLGVILYPKEYNVKSSGKNTINTLDFALHNSFSACDLEFRQADWPYPVRAGLQVCSTYPEFPPRSGGILDSQSRPSVFGCFCLICKGDPSAP